MRSKELRVGRWKCAVHKHELNVLNFPTELAETFDSKVRRKKKLPADLGDHMHERLGDGSGQSGS